MCRACGRVFSETTLKAIYRLRITERELWEIVIRLMMGEPDHEIARLHGVSPQRLAIWMTRLSREGQLHCGRFPPKERRRFEMLMAHYKSPTV